MRKISKILIIQLFYSVIPRKLYLNHSNGNIELAINNTEPNSNNANNFEVATTKNSLDDNLNLQSFDEKVDDEGQEPPNKTLFTNTIQQFETLISS